MLELSAMYDPGLLGFQEVEMSLSPYHHMLAERRSQILRPIMTMMETTTIGEPSKYDYHQLSPGFMTIQWQWWGR